MPPGISTGTCRFTIIIVSRRDARRYEREQTCRAALHRAQLLICASRATGPQCSLARRRYMGTFDDMTILPLDIGADVERHTSITTSDDAQSYAKYTMPRLSYYGSPFLSYFCQLLLLLRCVSSKYYASYHHQRAALPRSRRHGH